MPVGLLILLVIGLVAAVFIGFGVMVVVVAVKTIAFAFRALLWKPVPIVHPTFYCTQIRCHTPNPASARFCRRCGAPAQSRVVYRMTYANSGTGCQPVISRNAGW